MSSIQEQIQEVEDEIRKTQYNKATSHHIGRLKAKIARLRDDVEKKASAKNGGDGYSVRKSGDGTVTLVGFPSVGKSTLLNKLTDAKSEVGAYDFTTLTVVPGVLDGLFDTLDPVLIVERCDGLALGQVAALNETAGEGKLRSFGIKRNIRHRQIIGDAFAYCCPFRVESADSGDVDQIDILDKISEFIDPALDGHQAFYR